ncbi:sensor protein lytS [Rudanella paleaurantiibacter]|uniref:Sensor protein lytS n=1 Tax=Rudanella paleaurantiibacter TaxID=2614655 RepID=A0A7J5TVF6_9BACT|nr:sensor protein lytS [Rudanella paleaurantiibacter]
MLSDLVRGHTYLHHHAELSITDPQANWSSVYHEAHRFRPDPLLQTSARKAYWLWQWLKNDSDSARTAYIYTGSNQTVTLYLIRPPGQLIDSLQSGSMVPRTRWAYLSDDQFIPVRMQAGQSVLMLIRVANRAGIVPVITHADTPRPSVQLRLESELFHAQRLMQQYGRNLPELQYRSWVQGGLLFFLLFVVLIFVQYRQALYGYYALYVLAGCVYSLLKTRTYTPVGQVLVNFPFARFYALELVLWAGWGAYTLFLVELLNLRVSHPGTARRLVHWGRFAVGYSLVSGAVLMLTNDGGLYQLNYWACRFVFVTIHVVVLVWLLRSVPSVLTRYVVLGNVLLTGIGILASLRASELILKDTSLPGFVDNLLMLPLGVLLEIIVFALALAHRIRLVDRERQASQQAYVEEIEQRTAYEKRLAEVEMLALRSQMNPHFLFNSLNTIEYFVLKGDEANATRYLSSFSRLLRLILNHSNEDTVRLSEDLTGLHLYLELESSRFDENFRYTLEVDPAIDPDDVVIPPLLLQPFVENAIWHGLQHSHRPDKRLWVRVLLDADERILFEIEDNGIGRAEAGLLKSRSSTRRNSLGMSITKQRIDLLNRNYQSKLHVELVDLLADGQSGTLVRITLQPRPNPSILDQPN